MHTYTYTHILILAKIEAHYTDLHKHSKKIYN